MHVTTVLIGESYDIPLAGIRTILANSRAIDVVAVAKSSRNLYQRAREYNPDVCLLTSTLRGLHLETLLARLKKLQPPPRVLFLSSLTNPVELDQALKAGVDGYLLANANKELLRETIDRIMNGEKAFDKTTSHQIYLRYVERLRRRSAEESGEGITKREAEILNYIVEGWTSREIAQHLYISPRTVETHRSNLLKKLNIKNTATLVRFALEGGGVQLT